MSTRLFLRLAMATIVVTASVAWTQASFPEPERRMTPPAVVSVPDAQPLRPWSEPSAGEQMMALARHARVDMVLFGGRMSTGDVAARRSELDAVALNMIAKGRTP